MGFLLLMKICRRNRFKTDESGSAASQFDFNVFTSTLTKKTEFRAIDKLFNISYFEIRSQKK